MLRSSIPSTATLRHSFCISSSLHSKNLRFTADMKWGQITRTVVHTIHRKTRDLILIHRNKNFLICQAMCSSQNYCFFSRFDTLLCGLILQISAKQLRPNTCTWVWCQQHENSYWDISYSNHFKGRLICFLYMSVYVHSLLAIVL